MLYRGIMRPGGTDGQSSSRCRPPIISPSTIRLSSASSSLSQTKQDNKQSSKPRLNTNRDQVHDKDMTTITTKDKARQNEEKTKNYDMVHNPPHPKTLEEKIDFWSDLKMVRKIKKLDQPGC